MKSPLLSLATALAFGIATTFTHAQLIPEYAREGLHRRQSSNSGNCQQQQTYQGQCGTNYDYTGFPQDQQERAEAVIAQFRFAWNGYRQYAFPHDDLLPQNNSFSDSRNGWGLTAIDGLDTAIIMEQKDIVDDILQFIPTVDFTKNNSPGPTTTSLFETTIRYLGGLLSAYDLLKGPFSDLATNDDNVDALLTQAKTLADTLKFAFNTTTGIPVNTIDIDRQSFAEQPQDGQYTAGLAEFGSLILEWQHLSDLSGDPSYGELASRAEQYFFNAQEVWPGLTGGQYSVNTGAVTDQTGGWIGGSDSAYEYLIKMFVYDPSKYSQYRDRWISAADSTIAYLISSPSSRPDLRMAGAYSGQQVINYTEQLACFIGGNFLLASTVLSNTQYRDYGLSFSEFCANGYRYTASGIGPLLYSWNTTLLSNPNVTSQTNYYNSAGYFIPDPDTFNGGQSPEAVESWYYAYQTTGNQYWRDVAWAYTVAQNNSLVVGSGFSDCVNVLEENGGGFSPEGNLMDSFMLAEVLKYQYLIQTPKRGPWHVQEGSGKKNEFVYNTEAHPFRVRAQNPV
ncbi:hypothetical protein PRZ48_014305 [Zasmidium cellare]|uniref:alpha-1,2-Mannosidase n=1 Tax=Zasmidium cellare TaxID=395010 RepID=A0ABR0E0K6_ZASCE|nr:hypothetical protein PRZ48_014305 [Zasmidium cellare]